jgi:hypothetical protein
MRNLFWLAAVLVALVFAGCARKKTSESAYQSFAGAPATKESETPTSAQVLMVKAAEGLNGKVSSANANAKFVVLTFPVGQMAEINQRLNVYRGELKVGEVKVTGPQGDDSIVADILVGGAQPGDEVRDR